MQIRVHIHKTIKRIVNETSVGNTTCKSHNNPLLSAFL